MIIKIIQKIPYHKDDKQYYFVYGFTLIREKKSNFDTALLCTLKSNFINK